jgi:predicted nucleic acid-binding protein
VDRVFLDANVLFSAAYREDAGLLRLWRLEDTRLLTSVYAMDEARRNLAEPAQRERLDRLVPALEVCSVGCILPPGVAEGLPDKDRPILQSAVAAGATHLLTGDVSHFGPLFGQTVAGVLVLRPAAYLRGKG